MTEFKEVWYTSQDGLRLFARDYPYRGPNHVPNHGPNHGEETHGTTVVCIPGLTRNSADFHELCVILQKRWRVIAVDLRGRGRSEYDSNPANYVPAVYVQDVQALIAELALEQVVLVGTSLGALVSLLVSAGRPDYLRALVMNDFGPDLDRAGLDRIKAYVGKSTPVRNWDEAVAQSKLINGTELPDLSDQAWLAFTRNIYREDAQGRPVLAYDPAISQPFEDTDSGGGENPLWAAYQRVPAVPILLLRGSLSDLLPMRCVAEMQRRRTDLLYAEIPNRGHAPLLNEPSAVQAIESLLSSLRY